ncbi:MAG: SusF/SusE family outer membrane protein [Muribaculaceae bacterium]|nr:SusF/SusE family outer membrane protein [Muribaculaceae bacterium]
MKLSLRNLAMGAAIMMAGSMVAQDAPTVKLQWSKDLTGYNKNDTRFGIGHGGKVFFNEKGSGKVMVVDANGATEYAAVAGIGTGITCDEAGNLLVNKGFPGATSATNWVIITPSGEQKELTLTMPEGVEAARVDQVGRVIGDVMSEAGGIFYLGCNGASQVAMIYVANGAQATLDGCDYYSIEKPADLAVNTSSIFQPMYDFETTAGLGDDACSAYAARNRNSQSVFYYNGSEWATFVKPAGAGTQEGFDVFNLGGVDYQIQPCKVAQNYESKFLIADVEGNIIYTDENADAGDGSQNFGSYNVEKVDDNTYNVYQWFTSGKSQRAAMWTVSLSTEQADPLYIVGDATPAGWSPENAVEFTFANGVYTYDFGHQTAGKSFKISTAKGDWDTFNAGVIGANLVLNEAVAIDPAWNTNTNLSIAANGTYKVIVDLTAQTIKLEGEKDAAAAPQEYEIYLRGDINNWGNDEDHAIMLANHKFSCVGVEGTFRVYALYIPGEITGVFKFATDDWTTINMGAAGENSTAVVGPRIELAPGSNTNITAGPGLGNVTFKLYHSGDSDVNSYFEVLSGNQAVDTIVVDENAPATYYNLQGVEVDAANLQGGVYVKVAGGKATKVIVK